jgi:hypothetical protein
MNLELDINLTFIEGGNCPRQSLASSCPVLDHKMLTIMASRWVWWYQSVSIVRLRCQLIARLR